MSDRPDKLSDTESLSTVHKLVNGKKVALVGNAASLFDKPREIDSSDIVLRMNRGFSLRGTNGNAGYRTDILLVSGFRTKEILNASPVVIYMSPKYRNEVIANGDHICFYPLPWWEDLSKELGGGASFDGTNGYRPVTPLKS